MRKQESLRFHSSIHWSRIRLRLCRNLPCPYSRNRRRRHPGISPNTLLFSFRRNAPFICRKDGFFHVLRSSTFQSNTLFKFYTIMNKIFLKILSLLALTCSALAHEGNWTASRPDGHGPISVMGDHMHKMGEWMISCRYMTMDMKGLNKGSNSDQSECQWRATRA